MSLETNVFISRNTYDRWLGLVENYKILYLHAMVGYGKTTQATEFAKRYFKVYSVFDARSPDFYEKIEDYLIQYKATPIQTLAIIDNVEAVNTSVNGSRFFGLLSSALEIKNINLMLLSVAPLPKHLLPFKLSKNLGIDDRRSLKIGMEQIVSLMKRDSSFSSLKTAELKRHATKCLEFSSGYVIAVLSYLERLAENIYNAEVTFNLAESDLHSYFEMTTMSLTETQREQLLRLCVFDEFTSSMAQRINAKIDLGDLLSCGYLEKTPSGAFSFEPNFYRYIQAEMLKTDLFDPKELLQKAGEFYEKHRNMREALRCFSLAENYEKLEEIVIYLSENADGCEFAEICEQYMDEFLPESESNNARLLGAKAMIEAYSLRKSGYDMYLGRLKEIVDQKKDKQALTVYMRTLVACPIANADNLKDSLLLFVEYVAKNGVALEFIMPTGNMPSLLNGGLDLLAWSTTNKFFQTMITAAVEAVIGFEAVGAYHTIMGETLYERNQMSSAMEHLAKGLDESTRGGSVRMQYAATAIMAKLFCSENNIEKAEELFENFYQKAKAEHFMELLPNIRASMVNIALKKGELAFCKDWLENFAPNEFKKFYLTQRYVLLAKAKVYVALGRGLDALHIITVLDKYTEIAERKYLKVELNILKTIIYYHRGEPWQDYLLQAVKIAQEYKLVRIISDYGSALLPMFDEVKWEKYNTPKAYIDQIQSELKKSARFYPSQLKSPQKYEDLTQKETEVLYLLVDGYKNEQMAQELGISERTVKFHISNIMKKFEVKNRASIVKKAHDEGLV